MDISKEYATDEKKELEGVWEDIGDGGRILIARTNNPKYEKLFTKLIKPHRGRLRRGNLSDELSKEITVKLLADTILLDWEGIEEDGESLQYSKPEAERLLKDYKDFRNMVSEMAGEIDLFRQEEEEEDQ